MRQFALTKELRALVMMWGICGAVMIPCMVIIGMAIMSIPLLINILSFTFQMALDFASNTFTSVIVPIWPVMLKLGLGFTVFGYIVAFGKLTQTNHSEVGEVICVQ